MKAVVCTRYGPPEVLQLQEVPDPVPRAKDVLIRIRTTTVTPSDCYIRSAIPSARLFMRLMARVVIGFTRPRRPILGAVLAGEIEAIGSKVKAAFFQPAQSVRWPIGFRLITQRRKSRLLQTVRYLTVESLPTFQPAPLEAPQVVHRTCQKRP